MIPRTCGRCGGDLLRWLWVAEFGHDGVSGCRSCVEDFVGLLPVDVDVSVRTVAVV